jgi:hypothetical protein
MEPFPEPVSADCCDLIGKMLAVRAADRISVRGVSGFLGGRRLSISH